MSFGKDFPGNKKNKDFHPNARNKEKAGESGLSIGNMCVSLFSV